MFIDKTSGLACICYETAMSWEIYLIYGYRIHVNKQIKCNIKYTTIKWICGEIQYSRKANKVQHNNL